MTKPAPVKTSRCRPTDCTADEIDSFTDLVRAAFGDGSHDRAGRIARAHTLVFLREGDELAGIAALKVPPESHTRQVFLSAGVALPERLPRYELGWVVVDGRHRGKRYSGPLVESALLAAGDTDLFATSHDGNVRMHRTLRRHGFAQAGEPYYSSRHGRELVLFLRAGRRTSVGT